MGQLREAEDCGLRLGWGVRPCWAVGPAEEVRGSWGGSQAGLCRPLVDSEESVNGRLRFSFFTSSLSVYQIYIEFS